MARLIDTRAASNKIHEYMEDFPRAETRLATCRVILSMLGDENQIHTIDPVHAAGACYCRECKHWKEHYDYCKEFAAERNQGDFCSCGEKRNVDENTHSSV